MRSTGGRTGEGMGGGMVGMEREGERVKGGRGSSAWAHVWHWRLSR